MKSHIYSQQLNLNFFSIGFAFLCPNGTLFNQKVFVCDWYTNVDCDGSENYYMKNKDLNVKLDNFLEIMFTANKMISFPRDAKDPSRVNTLAPIAFNSDMFKHSNSSTHSNEKLVINKLRNNETPNELLRTNVKPDLNYKADSTKLNKSSESVPFTPVYVSSLGELSTHSENGFYSNRATLLEFSDNRTFLGFADIKTTRSKPIKNREYLLFILN